MIQELHQAGNTDKDIITTTNYPSKTVYKVVKRLKAGEGIEHKSCGIPKNTKMNSNLQSRPQEVYGSKPRPLHGSVDLEAIGEQEIGEEGGRAGPTVCQS